MSAVLSESGSMPMSGVGTARLVAPEDLALMAREQLLPIVMHRAQPAAVNPSHLDLRR